MQPKGRQDSTAILSNFKAIHKNLCCVDPLDQAQCAGHAGCLINGLWFTRTEQVIYIYQEVGYSK